MRLTENSSRNLARQILHGSNPACEDCPLEETELLTDGITNISIRCCHLPPECNPVVVNLLTHPNGNNRIAQETYVRELCAPESDLPLQRLIKTGSLGTGTDKINFIVKEYKPGITFHQTLTNHEITGASDVDFSRMLNQLGRFLSMMHKIKFTGFGKISGRHIIGPSEDCSWAEYYQHRLKGMFDAISLVSPEKRVGTLRAEEVQTLLPPLFQLVNEHSELLGQVQEASFVHHDFHFLNIIADDEPEWSITGILDTENATAGDPTIDFVSIESHLYLSREKYGGVFERNADHFRKGYAQEGQIPVNYPGCRVLYHILWSLSYFEAILNIDTEVHPITPEITHYANRHFSILKGLADGRSLEEIGVISIF